MIHHATLVIDNDELTHWVSLDGDNWLPINRAPVEGEEDMIQRIFDGDGKMMPMRAARRFLEHHGANFITP